METIASVFYVLSDEERAKKASCAVKTATKKVQPIFESATKNIKTQLNKNEAISNDELKANLSERVKKLQESVTKVINDLNSRFKTNKGADKSSDKKAEHIKGEASPVKDEAKSSKKDEEPIVKPFSVDKKPSSQNDKSSSYRFKKEDLNKK